MIFQSGDIVRVVDAIDVEIHDVSMHIGRLGLVWHLITNDIARPTDPLFEVRFGDRSGEAFWTEELAPVRPRS